MNVWLIYRKEDIKKNDWYIKQYEAIGKELGLTIELVLTEEISFQMKSGKIILLRNQQEVTSLDGAIVRTIDPKLSECLEQCKIRCFNRAVVSTVCNDKARTAMYAAHLSIPMIPTLSIKREFLKRQMQQLSLPRVVKTVDGHGGTEVFLVEEYEQVESILKKTSSDFVVQPLIGKRHQDLRVYVLGNQILAAILRTSVNGFQANYSLGGTVNVYTLSEKEEKTVRKIMGMLPFDLIGIDFIIDDDGQLILNEMEDVVGARMLYQCTEINLVFQYLTYIKQELS